MTVAGADDAGPVRRPRPWYRRTWKRVLLSLVLAAALGAGAGQAYLAAGDQTERSDVGSALTSIAAGVTKYAASQRGTPIDLEGPALEGDDLSLAELRGKPVVLNVWGSWCAPCREEAPVLAEASRRYAGEVAFLGINIRDNRSKALAFEKRFGITYPSFADFDGSTVLSLNDYVPVNVVPVTLVLDAEGRVAARVLGVLRKATLSALLDTVLRETSPPRTAEAPR